MRVKYDWYSWYASKIDMIGIVVFFLGVVVMVKFLVMRFLLLLMWSIVVIANRLSFISFEL